MYYILEALGDNESNYYSGGLTISHQLLREVTVFAVTLQNDSLGICNQLPASIAITILGHSFKCIATSFTIMIVRKFETTRVVTTLKHPYLRRGVVLQKLC